MPNEMSPETKKQLMSILTKSLTGAGIGAGALGLGTMMGSKKDDPNQKSKLLKAMLLGGGMGALGGAGYGAYKELNPVKKELFTPGYKMFRQLTGDPTAGAAIGAATGAGGNIFSRYKMNKFLTEKMKNEPWLENQVKTEGVTPPTPPTPGSTKAMLFPQGHPQAGNPILDPTSGKPIMENVAPTAGSPGNPGAVTPEAMEAVRARVRNLAEAGRLPLQRSGINNTAVIEQLKTLMGPDRMGNRSMVADALGPELSQPQNWWQRWRGTSPVDKIMKPKSVGRGLLGSAALGAGAGAATSKALNAWSGDQPVLDFMKSKQLPYAP